MQSKYPAAAKNFEQGETLLAAAKTPSDVEAAEKMLRAAATEAKESALAPRLDCEALTMLGRHDDALTACKRSLSNNATGMGLRAMVGALLSGGAQPTSSDLSLATVYANRAGHLMPDDPYGAAAECDIAQKLGDLDMLNDCTNRLASSFPTYSETAHFEALRSAHRPGWGVATFWLSFLGLAFGTLLRAVVRSRRGSRYARTATTVVALGALSTPSVTARANDSVASTASSATATNAGNAANAADDFRRPMRAGSLSKYPIDDANPVSSVPTLAQRDKDPLEYGYFLMDLGDRADHALARGDHAAAAKFYAAVVKAVPDMSVGYSKACTEYEAAHDLDTATEYCAGALTGQGVTLADFSHYARVVLAKPGDPSQKDVTNLSSVIAHLKEKPESRSVAWDIECNLGVRLADRTRLETCAPELAKLAPNEPKVVFYQWVLALQHRDYAAAWKLVDRAKSTNQEPERAKEMAEVTFRATPIWRRGFRDWRVGALIAGALFGALALMLFRRKSVSEQAGA
jgi:tetratricopeptide (TPR) repeat protein